MVGRMTYPAIYAEGQHFRLDVADAATYQLVNRHNGETIALPADKIGLLLAVVDDALAAVAAKATSFSQQEAVDKAIVGFFATQAIPDAEDLAAHYEPPAP